MTVVGERRPNRDDVKQQEEKIERGPYESEKVASSIRNSNQEKSAKAEPYRPPHDSGYCGSTRHPMNPPPDHG
jgi:hypothetical protein